VSRGDRDIPRHALECELTPQVPDERVRDAMAAFYKSSEGYAHQQATHSPAYFDRLLGVLDSVLRQPKLQVLEIGAGAGTAMHAFVARRPGARAIAMELSPSSIRASRDRGSPSLLSVAGSALQLPFRDRSLDAVIAFEVIEHVPDVATALDEMMRVVRRPGHIIIGLPNHASLWTPLEDRLRRRDRRAFGVVRGRGSWRWWKRNAALAWRKRLASDAQFLYREPILHVAAGGDADAVYYAAPVDLIRFFRRRGARVATSSARLRWGWPGRFVPVELQGSTVIAWRIV
jgi:SAM-dependent methyltransferase